jgi:hypothetical protein
MDDLEALIRRYVVLGKRSPKGFEVVKCLKCNDYKERGGFKFEGGRVGYSCFNCHASGGFDPQKHVVSVPLKLKEILLAFNIPESEIDSVVKAAFFKNGGKLKVDPTAVEAPVKKHVGLPQELSIPRGTSLLTAESTDPWAQVALEYLKGRALGPQDHAFMISDLPAYQGRLIIPYYFRGKVIYWQGRSLDDSIQPRYKNPTVEKENILFNLDELYRHTDEPLFVSEGSLDAISIGQLGVALTGSVLTEFKIRELQRVSQRRKVIFLIDKNKNGYDLGMQALDLGFYVTTFPDNIEDANHARVRHGHLWLVSYLATTHSTGFAGKLTLKLTCKV